MILSILKRKTEERFNILKGPFDCRSNHVIYIIECEPCITVFLIKAALKLSLSTEEITKINS